MAILAKRTIKDRLAVGDNKYLVEQLEDGRIKLTPAPDEVSEEGTAINADLLQPLEDARVEHATAIENKMDKSNPTGTGSFSLNRKSGTTVGANSHAVGNGTTASGSYSHAEGSDATASGFCSHAEGYITTASGNYGSHAEGNKTFATGNGSHAEGNGTTASNTSSHAEGNGTKAASADQHAQGKYNVEDAAGTYADIIGNGESDASRSNAATVDWSGNAWYAGDVYVGSTSGTNKDEGSKKLATEEYVDSAVSIYKGEEEEIVSATITERVQSLLINVDSNGNAFSLKRWKLIISFQPHPDTSTSPYYWAYASLALPGATETITMRSNKNGTAAVFQGDSESGAGWCTYPATDNDTTGTNRIYRPSATLTGVEILGGTDEKTYLPQGMKVTIMGVRE